MAVLQAAWDRQPIGDRGDKVVYRLGDLVAWLLSSIGVTKDRWARWTGEKPSGCGKRQCSKCNERQTKLNRYSDWFAAKWRQA